MLNPYFSQRDHFISVSADQASTFAKLVCHDFNPIHNPDNKRFCVPGDLLFSIALQKYGISKKMEFEFTNMVGADMGLIFPDKAGQQIVICNEKEKSVMEIARSGEVSEVTEFIESFTKNYVEFSGENFPALLMPLMQEHQVMFNTARPLVMYNSMSFEFDTLIVENEMTLALSGSKMDVEPKRANSFLYFDIFDGEKKIGHGVKKLIVAGLKPYDHEQITDFVANFEAKKQAFKIAL